MKRIYALAALFLLGPIARADDWPQWLGASRDGSTPEKIVAWKEPLKVLWKQPVGEGRGCWQRTYISNGHLRRAGRH